MAGPGHHGIGADAGRDPLPDLGIADRMAGPKEPGQRASQLLFSGADDHLIHVHVAGLLLNGIGR